MDKDIEGPAALAKLKNEFSDSIIDPSQLASLIRREHPDWSDEQVEALFKDVDVNQKGVLHFGDLVDFVLDQPPIIISGPAYTSMGAALRRTLNSQEDDLVSWERFPSGDPNTRFQWRKVSGRRVVFLFDTSNQSCLFEQLSLLQALQGFPVPDGDDSRVQWKAYAASGRYAWGRAAEIVVVLPWYRPCQMDRTSRWQREEAGAWTNSDPAGEWLDVATAQTLVRLLGAPGPPLPGPAPAKALDGRPLEPLWRPPLRLLFLELHEEAPVQRAAGDLGVQLRFERLVPNLLSWFRDHHPGGLKMQSTFLLLPDRGAYLRYANVAMEKLGIAIDHVLWTTKRRKGAEVQQGQQILFQPHPDVAEEEVVRLGPDDHVIVVDDFTHSGSTLFGAVKLVRSLPGAGDSLRTSIIVPHTVACYDDSVLQAFMGKLEELGPQCRYITTDTLPKAARALRGHRQVDVVAVAEFLAEMLRS